MDADDQLNSTSGGYAYLYAYNNNGEQTGCTIGGVLSQFTYDYEGNLTGISSPGSVVTFAYDGQGRQTGRTNNGVASGYYLDGDTTLAEKQGSTWTDSYVWGVGQSRHNGEFVMHDALGSQCQLTNASDTITASDTMTAYGVGTNWSWTVTPTNK